MSERKYTKICVFCGEPFTAASAAARYCSGQCREGMAWERARQKGDIHTCPQCGKQFIKAGTYCSRGCYYAAMKAGKTGMQPAFHTEAHQGAEARTEADQGTEADRGTEATVIHPEPRTDDSWDIPEEWGVSPENMDGYREPDNEEKTAFCGRGMVPVLDISFILLLAAAGFFMFYLPTACIAVSAGCLVSICCILRHMVHMAEASRLFAAGQFTVMECRADTIYHGDACDLVLIHNAAGQYCSRPFELRGKDAQMLKRDAGRMLLLARCGSGKSQYRLAVKKLTVDCNLQDD